MKKITYLVLHLGYGGVEKAVANQANILCKNYDVEIISAYKIYDTPPFYIDPRVKITYLMTNLKPNKAEFKAAIQSKNPVNIIKQAIIALKVLRKRVSLMKKAVKNLNSDIIISTRILYNPVLSKYHKPGIITISQEHRHHDNDEKYIQKLCKSVENLDYFMPVSQELTDFYAARLKNKHVICKYIPHNLDSWYDNVSTLTEKTIVSVGRFSPEKGYSDLIDIFNIFYKTHPDWKLALIGDGDQLPVIKEKINALKLKDNVILYGFQDKAHVNEILHNSSIYAMASFSESFGIVLIEAQSHGLPCVAFDSARGALEIIENNINGFLIPDRNKELFAEKLSLLADDKIIRQNMGKNGRKNSEKYKEENIAKQLNDFLNSIL